MGGGAGDAPRARVRHEHALSDRAVIFPVVSGTSDLTPVVGIIVAGVVGPGLGYLAAWRSDKRRFRHDRELKSGDDLVARLDDVQVALEKLGEACAEMRNLALAHGGDPDLVKSNLQAAEDAYQDARALIARLSMRPFADGRVVTKAREAAGEMMVGIRLVRHAVLAHGLPAPASTKALAGIGQVPDAIERGYAATEQYETLAREAVGKLLGRPARIEPPTEPSQSD